MCRETTLSRCYDLVIWDEIHCAIDYGFLAVAPVQKFLQVSRPPNVHILLTGRHADPALIELADMVSEVQEIKHHYARGIKGQPGIEF
jgi:cob(I)alamin adenosyltransferase